MFKLWYSVQYQYDRVVSVFMAMVHGVCTYSMVQYSLTSMVQSAVKGQTRVALVSVWLPSRFWSSWEQVQKRKSLVRQSCQPKWENVTVLSRK